MKIAIFGAGNMGAGIAQCFAVAGHEVSLHDQTEDAAGAAVGRVQTSVQRRIESGKMAPTTLDLCAGGRYDDADLIIEAVFEDLDVKKALFAKLASTNSVLATNTSSFQVADLAVNDRVIGLHFFFPAHVNRLVELVPGNATPGAVAIARHAMESIGKTVIVTADSPGFGINRFLVPILNEAALMLDEGIDMGTIEASGKAAFGMPLGPFTLMNASGTRVCAHAQENLHAQADASSLAASLGKLAPDNTPWEIAQGEPDVNLVARFHETLRHQLLWIAEKNVAKVEDLDLGAKIGLGWTVAPSSV